MTSDRRTRRQVTAVLGVLAGFGVLLVLLKGLGFFEFSGDEASAAVVAAAIGLVGAYLGGTLAIVGIVIKSGLEEQAQLRLEREAENNRVLQNQAERRLALESERNAALQREAERRLTIEAATKALQLCGTSAGTPTQPIQREGALYLLADLGQYRLALELTGTLLARGEVSSAAACIVLDAALERGTESDAITAVNLLWDNAPRMLSPTGADFPHCIALWKDSWRMRTTEYVRGLAADCIAATLTSRPLAEWRTTFEGQLCTFVAALSRAWTTAPKDTYEEIAVAEALLLTLMKFPRLTSVTHTDGTLFDLVHIRNTLEARQPATGSSRIANRLSTWL